MFVCQTGCIGVTRDVSALLTAAIFLVGSGQVDITLLVRSTATEDVLCTTQQQMAPYRLIHRLGGIVLNSYMAYSTRVRRHLFSRSSARLGNCCGLGCNDHPVNILGNRRGRQPQKAGNTTVQTLNGMNGYLAPPGGAPMGRRTWRRRTPGGREWQKWWSCWAPLRVSKQDGSCGTHHGRFG